MSQETRKFEAEVAQVLHLVTHSLYSHKEIFLRELISNASDACDKLRFEAIADPGLVTEDADLRIQITWDPEARTISVRDNGIGMTREDVVANIGTIASSGTRRYLEALSGEQKADSRLIGQFGVGFYSAFMVADKVDVFSRRAGADVAAHWASDGLGSYTIQLVDPAEAPARGTRIVLHLKEEAASYTEQFTAQRIITAQSGHVPVPIFLKERPEAEEKQIADGAALWTRPRSDITAEEYADFYRSTAGQFDEPALTLHYRAEGLHEYSVLAFLPSVRPFDLFDPDRAGRMKLYVRRVFITDEAQIVPRYLRFMRGLVDSNDLPLNVSREMIQESSVLAAIQKGVANRILSELDKLADRDADAYLKFWDNFGAVLKEGLYEDFSRREALLGLARFKSTTSGEGWRSLKGYVEAIKENQTAIYYATGVDLDRLASSPQLEGFRARGIEVLLLTDQVDSFWVTAGVDYQGKPFKSVTQGLAELSLIPTAEGDAPAGQPSVEVDGFIAYLKGVLGEEVSDVRASERLTESAVCLVAPDNAMDRQLEKLLAGAGRLDNTAKPVLEINPRHDLVTKLGTLAEDSELREDAAWLLLDEARIVDGELPTDPRAFSARLARLIGGAIK